MHTISYKKNSESEHKTRAHIAEWITYRRRQRKNFEKVKLVSVAKPHILLFEYISNYCEHNIEKQQQQNSDCASDYSG